MKQKSLLIVKELHKKYNDLEVLKGLNFTLNNQEMVAIMGRSGAGKTTFLNVVGALDSRFEGDVIIDGVNLRDMNDKQLSFFRAKNLGFVFQNFQLLTHLNVIENVALPSYFIETKENPMDRARYLLKEVGLEQFSKAKPNSLSSGQKQRVAIARALFNSPKLLLCDEPTGNLDLRTAEEIISLFKKINENEGLSIIIVTHDQLISKVVNRVLHMKNGCLEVEGD